ncbi:MAG: hypothetical protein RIR09_2390 [Pseudomonadota bacterium]|jgi:hypothetical protein
MTTMTPLTRRTLLMGALLLPLAGTHAAARPTVEVWKSPTCGCCKDWVAHLETNGYAVTIHEVGESAKAAQRAKLGMPAQLGSCHTAVVKGYVLEGHVPAREIDRLLKQRPRALGLAVPGMPVGSPGMDGPEYEGHVDPYAVLLVQRDGGTRVYQQYGR